VPVWVGRDRAAAGAALCQAHPDVNVLVCDDGLQHLSLARDAELVVFDERGAGNGHLLPAGPLREPIGAPSLARRQWTLYNASAPSTRLPGVCTRRELVGLVSLDDWWRGQPADPALVEQVRALGAITASAGIGQPQRFFDALQALGLVIQPWPLADHARLDPLPWPDSVQALVVTEKDAIKLDAQRLRTERPALRVWVAPLVFTLPDGLLDEISAELSVAVAPR
jgi:tetraacyldisaccharide 4'-kinase